MAKGKLRLVNQSTSLEIPFGTTSFLWFEKIKGYWDHAGPLRRSGTITETPFPPIIHSLHVKRWREGSSDLDMRPILH